MNDIKESDIFNNLITRFFLTLPNDELSSFNRILVHIQDAHWFYLDWLGGDLNFYEFCYKFFFYCPALSFYISNLSNLLLEYRKYKLSIPVCGCIILNYKKDKFILVKNKGSNSWTFPRGKINENESEIDCAIREVYEEIGLDVYDDISDHIFLEENVNGKKIKLFIITGIAENVMLNIFDKKEIAEVGWFSIKGLKVPTFDVKIFLNPLNNWIKNNKIIYNDFQTFGIKDKGWSVKDMYRINEEINRNKSSNKTVLQFMESL